mgnify:CR=1 FL=1
MIETKPFYTCKYDKAFKEIMMKEENFNILKKVLETILKVSIQEIKLQPLNLNTGNIHIKGKEVDLLVITEQGKIEVEVNTYYNDYVRVRNFSYITSIYNNQVTVGEKYNEDTNIIQINLNYGVKDTEYKRVYKVRDETGKEYIKNFSIYEINMEKLKEIWYDKNELEIEKNKYLLMLDMEISDLKKLSEDRVVKDYMEKIEKLNEDPIFINWITKEKDEQMIKNTQLYRATQEGINIGISQGINQGMKKEKLEIAKNLLEQNVDIDVIMSATGLTKEEIEKL